MLRTLHADRNVDALIDWANKNIFMGENEAFAALAHDFFSQEVCDCNYGV